MARIIKLNQIDDIMKECVEDLVEATTLKWTREVKKETPVRVVYKGEPRGGGQLRAAWQTDIKPLQGTITNNLPYANQFVMELIYQNHGVVFIEQDKGQLLVSQNL